MERNMSIRRTTDNCCSCNGCGARNYVSRFATPEEKTVDIIYEMRISMMVNRLCPDCLDALVKEIAVVRGSENNNK